MYTAGWALGVCTACPAGSSARGSLPAGPGLRSTPRPAARPRAPLAAPQPRVAVVLIGTNDLTNSGWSITSRTLKEKALDQQLPGILQR